MVPISRSALAGTSAPGHDFRPTTLQVVRSSPSSLPALGSSVVVVCIRPRIEGVAASQALPWSARGR